MFDFKSITDLLYKNNIQEAKNNLKKIIETISEEEIDDTDGLADYQGSTFGAKSVNPTGDNPTYKANGAGGRANQAGGPAHGTDWINTGKETEDNLPDVPNVKIPGAGRIRTERFKIATENLFSGNKDIVSDFTHTFHPILQQIYQYDYWQIANDAAGDKNGASGYASAKNNLLKMFRSNIISYLKENGFTEESINSHKTSIDGIVRSYLADGRQKTQIASKFKDGKGQGSDKSTTADQNAPVARRI